MEVQLKDDLVIIIGTTDQRTQVEYQFTARGAARAGLIILHQRPYRHCFREYPKVCVNLQADVR